MSEGLLNKKCIVCEGGVLPLSRSDIDHYEKQLKIPWEIIEDKKIRREFRFKNFVEAMNFTNKVAKIAGSEGHHPDIYIFYNRVVLELWTHAIGGLSENDFILAAKIEAVNL
jgi:4a-hydroxytetrahydrobiopterin dehydratase